MYKTENQIWTDFIGFVKTALDYYKITDFAVERNYQPTKGNFKPPYLLIHRIYNEPIGFQEKHNKIVGDKLEHHESEIEEIVFQIDAVKHRRPGHPEDLTSVDVLKKLRMWLNGDIGIQTIRQAGYNIFRVEKANEPVFTTDNDTFEINPNLDVHITFKQTEVSEVSAIERAEEEIIKGV